MDLIYFACLVLVAYLLSYRIMYALSHVTGSAYFLFRLILFPGVILHELAHMLACLITLTPIEGFSFWDQSGGHVLHHKPKLFLLTQPIISFAPFPVGIAALLYLTHFLRGHALWVEIVSGFLMLSIAGTFGPSQADIQPATWGTVLLLLLLVGVGYTHPNLITKITPYVQHFNHQMLFITLILLAIWAVLFATHFLFTKRR